jgi:hypothetical protein
VTISSFDLRGKVAGPKAVSDTQVIGFEVMATSEVSIVEVIDATGVETPMVEGVNYSITLSGTVPSDGTIKFLTALATGSTWYWVRNTTLDQQSPYVALDKFPSTTHERALDKLTLALQDLQDLAKRSLRAPTQDEAQDLVLGPKADRLDKFIKFDAVTGLPTLVNEVDITTVAFTAIGILVAEAASAAAIRGSGILNVLEDVLTTEGDLLVRGAAGEERLGVGAASTVLTISGGVPAWVSPAVQSLPRSYLAGLQMGNGDGAGAGDQDHDITVQPGTCRSSDNTTDMALAAAWAKQIDATWAVGTGAGGLNDADHPVQADTWYAVFAISKADGTTDVGFDSDGTGAQLLADAVASAASYTKLRRLGWVRTNNLANIQSFTQNGDEILWSDPFALEALETETKHVGTGPHDPAITLAFAMLPPSKVTALIFAGAVGFPRGLYLSSPAVTDESPNFTYGAGQQAHGNIGGGNAGSSAILPVRTSSTGTLRLRTLDIGDYSMLAAGWIDARGRNA